jgi:hypothetical protein
MTEPVRPLEALIDKWREHSGLGSSQAAHARQQCADELAALLQAAAPPAPTAEQEQLEAWRAARGQRVINGISLSAAPPAPTAERIETMVVVTCGQRGFKTILPATDYNRVLAMLSDLAAPPAPTAAHTYAPYPDGQCIECGTWARDHLCPAAPPERVSEGKEPQTFHDIAEGLRQKAEAEDAR